MTAPPEDAEGVRRPAGFFRDFARGNDDAQAGPDAQGLLDEDDAAQNRGGPVAAQQAQDRDGENAAREEGPDQRVRKLDPL